MVIIGLAVVASSGTKMALHIYLKADGGGNAHRHPAYLALPTAYLAGLYMMAGAFFIVSSSRPE